MARESAMKALSFMDALGPLGGGEFRQGDGSMSMVFGSEVV